MTDEERLDLLDHARRCDVLAEENDRLRRLMREQSRDSEAIVKTFLTISRWWAFLTVLVVAVSVFIVARVR